MSDAAAAGIRLDQPLPIGPVGRHSNGYWGMAFVIMTEASLFAYLLFSFYYLAVQPHQDWPPGGLPDLKLALPDTILLLLSSAVVWWGESGLKQGRSLRCAAGLAGGFVMGTVFVVVQWFEWANKPFTLASNPYGSLFFVTTGFHMAHVIVGVIGLAALGLWTMLGYFDHSRYVPVSIGVLYWHFVDAVWVVVFFSFYLTPRLGCCHV
jgi:heme/copper-type cytochrome/quinol oxidase subunit 3